MLNVAKDSRKNRSMGLSYASNAIVIHLMKHGVFPQFQVVRDANGASQQIQKRDTAESICGNTLNPYLLPMSNGATPKKDGRVLV